MKRLLNDFKTSGKNFNNSEAEQVTEHFFIDADNAKDVIYAEFGYSNVENKDINNDNVGIDNLDTIGKDSLENYLSYTDLFFVDNNGYLHEINNSEFLFDGFFDYIVRGNYIQNNTTENDTLHIVDSGKQSVKFDDFNINSDGDQ